MNIWAVWPTVNVKKSNDLSAIWKDKGYHTGLLLNEYSESISRNFDLVIHQSKWEGFPIAVNVLCNMAKDLEADIVIVIGDDIYPDEKLTAQNVGAIYTSYFPNFDGIVQPTGDKYGAWDKCAVSPWIGKELISEHGPYCEKYFHYFCDEDLQRKAMLNNCFVQEDYVTQYHDHWERDKNKPERPLHLRRALAHWREDKETFLQREKKGFV